MKGQKPTYRDLENEVTRLKLELKIRDELLNTIPNPLFVKNKNFKYSICNNAFADYLGIPKSKIINATVYDISPKELADKYHAADCELRDQLGQQEYESKVKYADGTLHDIILNKACLLDEEKEFSGIVGIMLDITNRKQAEESLVENKSLLAKSESISNQGSWKWSIVDDKWSFSDNWLNIHGINNSGVSQKELMEIAHPDDASKVEKAMADALNNNLPYSLEHRIIRKDNGEVRTIKALGEVHFNTNGEPEYMIGVAQDISERKEAEEALVKAKKEAEKNEAKFRELFRNVNDAVFMYNPDTFEILEANKATSELYGYGYDELIGMSCLKFSAEPEKSKSVAKLIKNEKKVTVKLRHHKKKDGSDVFIELSNYNISVNGKNIIYSVCHDITDIKKTELELIKAKEKAEESEAFLQLINNATFDQIYSYDLNNRFTSANKTLCENLKLNADDIIGKSYWELDFPEENCKAWDELHRQTYLKGQITEIVATPMPDGSTQYFEVNLFVIKNSDGTALGIVGVNRNITESKLAEQKLINAKEKAEESERQLKLIADNFVNGMIYQVAMLDENRRQFNYISKNVKDLYGCTVKEAKEDANLIYGKLHPDDVNELVEKEKEALRNMSAFETEARAITPDGNIRWAYYISKPRVINGIVCWDGIEIDITERKQMELELRKAKEKAEESEEKFKLLNRLTSEMLLLQDMESIYKFIAGNLQKLHPNTIVLNVSIDESIQQSRLEVISGIDNSLLATVIKISGFNPIGKTYKLTDIHNNYFRSGGFIEFEGGLAEFSASEFPAVAASAIEKLIGLHKIYTIGINKDDGLLAAIHFFTFNKQIISDGNFIEVFAKQAGLVLQKKISEKALIKAKEKAEESDRLKSAFLANMSHEIRTPMNGILGFTNLLKEPGLDGVNQQKFISVIEKSGERMLNTVNDIIDISKIEAGQIDVTISDINLNKQLDELFEFFLPEATKKNIQLSITSRVPNHHANLRSDKEKLNSILTNFIKNAIKYTHAGSIEFGCSINKKTKQKELKFYVKDTGIGISKERQKAVFGRFIQADIEDKQAYEGSGLGLAISKAYVEMLGGKTWVESEEGIGSQFYFTIPYETTNKEIHKNNTQDSNKPLSVKKGLKVLIVEDDEFAISLLRIILKEYAKEMLVAKTGIEAVEMCRDNPELDIVLMDIKIPGIDGYEATRKIREFNKEVFIVAQTAYAQSGDREKSIQAGCNEYISKPIDKEKFLEIIANRF